MGTWLTTKTTPEGYRKCRGCGGDFRVYPMCGVYCRDCKRLRAEDRKRARQVRRRLRRPGRYANRGRVWERAKQQKRLFAHVGRCEVCGMPEVTHVRQFHGKLANDHIVPVQVVERLGGDPDQMANLMELCNGDHGTKLQADLAIMDGNVVGYKTILERAGWPMDRVQTALELYGFR